MEGFPLTQKELEQMECPCGEAHPVYFHARCHPNDPTWCEYDNGVLTITCSVCRRPIVDVAVKESADG